MHHVAYRVENIDAALATLRAVGVQLVDEQPRQASTTRAWHSCILKR